MPGERAGGGAVHEHAGRPLSLCNGVAAGRPQTGPHISRPRRVAGLVSLSPGSSCGWAARAGRCPHSYLYSRVRSGSQGSPLSAVSRSLQQPYQRLDDTGAVTLLTRTPFPGPRPDSLYLPAAPAAAPTPTFPVPSAVAPHPPLALPGQSSPARCGPPPCVPPRLLRRRFD